MTDEEAIGDVDNVISLEQFLDAHTKDDGALDDDELIRRANKRIAEWKAAGTPTLTQVQELFHELICAGASAMARDKIVGAILTAFDAELGGKRALVGTWGKLAKDYAAERVQDARKNITHPELTPAEKAALRESRWPTVCVLAQSSDLIDRMVKQVQAMGVVNERELIISTYITATSRVLTRPNTSS